MALGLVWGQVGGVSITMLRKVNGRLAADPNRGPLTPKRLVAGHLGAIGLDFARGAALTVLGVVVGRKIVLVGAASWPLDADDTLGLLLVGGAVSAGILLRSFGGFRRRSTLFGAGIVLGLLGAWLL